MVCRFLKQCAAPSQDGLYPIHLLALEGLFTVVAKIESNIPLNSFNGLSSSLLSSGATSPPQTPLSPDQSVKSSSSPVFGDDPSSNSPSSHPSSPSSGVFNLPHPDANHLSSPAENDPFQISKQTIPSPFVEFQSAGGGHTFVISPLCSTRAPPPPPTFSMENTFLFSSSTPSSTQPSSPSRLSASSPSFLRSRSPPPSSSLLSSLPARIPSEESSRSLSSQEICPEVEARAALRKRKMTKKQIQSAVGRFNTSAADGIRFLQSCNLLSATPEPPAVAIFLRHARGLRKDGLLFFFSFLFSYLFSQAIVQLLDTFWETQKNSVEKLLNTSVPPTISLPSLLILP